MSYNASGNTGKPKGSYRKAGYPSILPVLRKDVRIERNLKIGSVTENCLLGKRIFPGISQKEKAATSVSGCCRFMVRHRIPRGGILIGRDFSYLSDKISPFSFITSVFLTLSLVKMIKAYSSCLFLPELTQV